MPRPTPGSSIRISLAKAPALVFVFKKPPGGSNVQPGLRSTALANPLPSAQSLSSTCLASSNVIPVLCVADHGKSKSENVPQKENPELNHSQSTVIANLSSSQEVWLGQRSEGS